MRTAPTFGYLSGTFYGQDPTKLINKDHIVFYSTASSAATGQPKFDAEL